MAERGIRWLVIVLCAAGCALCLTVWVQTGGWERLREDGFRAGNGRGAGASAAGGRGRRAVEGVGDRARSGGAARVEVAGWRAHGGVADRALPRHGDGEGDGGGDGRGKLVFRADVSGDGALGEQDLYVFAGWWTSASDDADFDRDGDVNVRDIAGFLDAYLSGERRRVFEW